MAERADDARHWARARELFDACVDLDAAQRKRYLLDATAGEPEVRALVERLLATHADLAPTRDDRIARGIDAGVGALWCEAPAGARFGAFRVVRELARGGMGVVYLAERDDGTVAQRVALKLVGSAQFGPASSMRLAREYRMLAALEHPHIARLIDAGTASDGTAYFAMEYVDGAPITRHCDERALPLRARLALFLDVCAAVQYAHAQLVVHRDIKAANVLVRDDGLAKLLDFGIAAPLADASSYLDDASSPGAFLSPHSAAPEQFRPNDRIGVAADVYALGVLLCELAGGSRPIDVDGLDANAAMERVAVTPPRLPSTAIDDAGARRRGADKRKLQRALRGDIDAIVARCLEKDPQRRYASVALLAEDIERHLARRPIAIRAHERGYRARRFVRRHALPVGLGALAATLLVGFVAYGIVTNRELERQRDEARMRERQAVFQRSRAEAVTDFLVGLFRSTTPEQTRGHAVSARELVDRGRASVEGGLAAQPDLKASMLSALSDVYLAFDDLDTAERLARGAAALRDASADAPLRAESLLQLAAIDNRRARPEDALAAIDAAAAAGTEETSLRMRWLATRADALHLLGRDEQSLALLHEGMDLAREAYGGDDPRLLRAAARYANGLRAVGRVDDAQAVLARILPLMRRNLAADDPELAEVLLAMALHARNGGRAAEAEPLAREALEVDQRIYGEHSTQTKRAASALATIVSALGRDTEAAGLFERAIAIDTAIYGADSLQVGMDEFNLGSQLQTIAGRADEALAHLQRGVAIGAKQLPADHINLAIYRLALGASLREQRRHAEADTVLRAALAVFEQKPGPRGRNDNLARGELACNALQADGDAAERPALEAALAVLRDVAPDDAGTHRLEQCLARTASPRLRGR